MKREEMVDIYNPDTLEKTGEVIAKRIAHEKGIWHSSIHLVIVNEDKLKTLFQRRASDKDLYPDAWDIAVGGHISAGEEDTIAVKRELEEELGLNPEKYNIALSSFPACIHLRNDFRNADNVHYNAKSVPEINILISVHSEVSVCTVVIVQDGWFWFVQS